MSQRKRLSKTQNSPHSQAKPRSETLVGEDEGVAFTQPSTSQVQRGLEALTPAQVDQKTAEVVQYFLLKDQKKSPIRRTDIVKHVLKEYRNIYPEIIKRASQIFEQVFGLSVVEVDTKNHIYILINKLERAEGAQLNATSSNPTIGLLFVILGTVFMKGGSVRETLIWNTLKKLHVDLGEKHEHFGDIKKMVTDEFVRQRYLEYVKIPHTDPVEYEFRWGQRAEFEVSRVKILEFMGELFDQNPEHWRQQFRDATNPTQSTQASANSQR